jgi:hypothetical protein
MTVEFFPHHCAVPTSSPAIDTTHAAKQLADAIANPHPNSPFNSPGDAQFAAIKTLSTIFTNLTNTPQAPRVAAPPQQQTHFPQTTVPLPTVAPTALPSRTP